MHMIGARALEVSSRDLSYLSRQSTDQDRFDRKQKEKFAKAPQRKSQYKILCVIWFAVFLLHFTSEMYKNLWISLRWETRKKTKWNKRKPKPNGECILTFLPATCSAKLKFRWKAELLMPLFPYFETNIIEGEAFDWKRAFSGPIGKHKSRRATTRSKGARKEERIVEAQF